MSSTFKDQDYSHLTNTPSEKVIFFLNDLRELLDKHKVKIYTNGCEVYIDKLGFVGTLEDNIETVEIVDGEDILFSSNIK